MHRGDHASQYDEGILRTMSVVDSRKWREREKGRGFFRKGR